MDILMRAGKEITGDLSEWIDDEERAFFRGRGSKETVDRVYFVRGGFVEGWARFSRYAFFETVNLQGDLQSGDAFFVKGPFKPLRRQVPEKFTRGQWRWRYLTDDMRNELRLR